MYYLQSSLWYPLHLRFCIKSPPHCFAAVIIIFVSCSHTYIELKRNWNMRILPCTSFWWHKNDFAGRHPVFVRSGSMTDWTKFSPLKAFRYYTANLELKSGHFLLFHTISAVKCALRQCGKRALHDFNLNMWVFKISCSFDMNIVVSALS